MLLRGLVACALMISNVYASSCQDYGKYAKGIAVLREVGISEQDVRNMQGAKVLFPKDETIVGVYASELKFHEIQPYFTQLCERTGFDRIYVGLREDRLLLWLKMSEKLAKIP